MWMAGQVGDWVYGRPGLSRHKGSDSPVANRTTGAIEAYD